MIRASIVTLVITVFLTSVGVASAGELDRRIVGILEIQASPEIAASFEQSLEEQLDGSQYTLISRAKMRERLRNSTKWSEGCLVGDCLSEVMVQTSAELVVLAALTGSGTSFGYVVTLVRTDTGRILSQESDRCEVCTINEAMTAATLATIRLVTAVSDELPADSALPAGKTRRSRRIAIAVTVVGLVAAGLGTALYFAQDKPDYALVTAAAGGGLALGGLVVLTF